MGGMASNKIIDINVATAPLEQLVIMQGLLTTKLIAVNRELAKRLDALGELARELPGPDDTSDEFFNAAELAREMNEALEPALSELRGETTTLRG